jgi:hypothetical protein
VLDVTYFFDWTKFLAELVNVSQELYLSLLLHNFALRIVFGLIICMRI